MDLCITAEEPFQPLKASKPFAPLAQPSEPAPTPTSPHHLHPLASPSPSPYQRGADFAGPGGQNLEFDLLIYDDENDSSLTHPWEVPSTPLHISPGTTKAQLVALLRTHLPAPLSCPPGLATTSDVETSSRRPYREATGSGGNASRHPKLASATLYWTYRGAILPLGPSDTDWHYCNPITKTDLLGRSESEWFLLREMMTASNGMLKCYIAIRSEKPVAKKTGNGRWFGIGR